MDVLHLEKHPWVVASFKKTFLLENLRIHGQEEASIIPEPVDILLYFWFFFCSLHFFSSYFVYRYLFLQKSSASHRMWSLGFRAPLRHERVPVSSRSIPFSSAPVSTSGTENQGGDDGGWLERGLVIYLTFKK